MPWSLMHPSDYPRRVLLCVTGLSPQIVTETLYALAQQNPPFIPTEVHVITTTTGAALIKKNLLAPVDGMFHRLCQDHFAGHAVRFEEDCINVVTRDGQPLADIETSADNTAVADITAQAVRGFTSDPNCALHASIAGGRKTMGFYLGYAVGLLGRPQDRLSHVLVSPPFESHPHFYYPPKQPVLLELPPPRAATLAAASRQVSTAEAQVMLAPIAFAPLNVSTQDALLSGHFTHQALVDRAMSSFVEAPMVLYCGRAVVRINDSEIELYPSLMAWLVYFAQARRDGTGPRKDGSYTPNDIDWPRFAQAQKRVSLSMQPVQDGFVDTDLRSIISKIKRCMKTGLGPAFHERYTIVNAGHQGPPPAAYGLRIAPALIHVA